MADRADKAVIDEVVVAINNALGLSARSKDATDRLKHFLGWYSTDSARAPRAVEVTMTGVLVSDYLDNRSLVLDTGETIDLGDVGPDTEGVKIKDAR